MKLTPQEAEILELIGIVDKKIRALPSLSDLHSQSLTHLHGVVCEIASRPYQRKIANETREVVNTAVVYHPAQSSKNTLYCVEYFDIYEGRSFVTFAAGENVETAVSFVNARMLSWRDIPAPIMGIWFVETEQIQPINL